MDNPAWLERVRAALEGRRLPRPYIERLLAELTDHFHDLTEESMATDLIEERLGCPEHIADAARQAYRPGLFQRHRWAGVAVFGVLPLPLLVAAWVLTFFAVYQALEAASVFDALRAHAERLKPLVANYESAISSGIICLILTLPAATLVFFYCRLAKRTRSNRWGIAASLLIAVGAGLVFHQLKLSPEPGKSMLIFGVGNKLPNGYQLVQGLLPLLVAWRCCCRAAIREEAPPVS